MGAEENKGADKLRNKWLFYILFIFLFCSFTNSEAEDVIFPPAKLSDLIGQSTCSLPPVSRIGMFRLSLNDTFGHALEFRRDGGSEFVFLLTGVAKPNDCARIAALIKLPKHKKSESIEFDCFLKKNKKREKRIIGIADNLKGRRQYAVAHFAWAVNLETNRFEPINNEIVICDTRGYAQ